MSSSQNGAASSARLQWLSFLGRVIAPVIAILVAVVAAASMGCERQVPPPLVEITELAPREIEQGDRLEVHGAGFPQGRTGHLTLEGTVFRAGEPPVRHASVEAEGIVVTPDRLEIVVREGVAERFTGHGDHAAHATFRGDVEVSFASNNSGAPPLVGVLRGATLDVLPSSPRASVVDARLEEGARVLAFLGITPGNATPTGLPVEQVAARSLAERSGIQVGDVLVSVDGVHVLSLADIVPASARAAEITIRHADSGTEETKTLSLVDYTGERVPREYAPALLVVGLALAVLVLLVLPGPPSIATLELRIASRVRRTTFREVLAQLVGAGPHAALSVIASAFIAALALTPYLVGREVDGVVWLVLAASMLVWSRVAMERGALRSFRATLQSGLVALVMAAAMALTVAQVGAIELAELVRVQGGAPWAWTAARHPACAILAVVYFVSIASILRTRSRDGAAPALAGEARDETAAAPKRAGLLERAGVLFGASLGVTAFLGGWQLPGVIEPRAHGLLLVAAFVFVVKTWCVAALLLGAGHVTSSGSLPALPRLVLRKLLPALVIAGGVVAASRRLVPSVAVETALGVTLVALGALFLVRLATRVRAAVMRPEPHASPFL